MCVQGAERGKGLRQHRRHVPRAAVGGCVGVVGVVGVEGGAGALQACSCSCSCGVRAPGTA